MLQYPVYGIFRQMSVKVLFLSLLRGTSACVARQNSKIKARVAHIIKWKLLFFRKKL